MITRLAALNTTAVVAVEDLVSVGGPTSRQVQLVKAEMVAEGKALTPSHMTLIAALDLRPLGPQTQEAAVVAVHPSKSRLRTLMEWEPMVVAES
jgi:hypothetical protein